MNEITSENQKYQFCQKTLELKEDIEHQYIALGRCLQVIRDKKLYEPFWDSFTEYLMEMRMSKGKASKIINIYQKYVQEYGIAEKRLARAGGWSVLAEPLPLIENSDDAEEWVQKAENMSQTDIRKEVKAKRTGVDPSECEHDDYYIIRICRNCKERVKVDDSEDE